MRLIIPRRDLRCKHLTLTVFATISQEKEAPLLGGIPQLFYWNTRHHPYIQTILLEWVHWPRKLFLHNLTLIVKVRCTANQPKRRKRPKALTGSKAERVAQRILESDGWTVHRAIKVTYQDSKGNWRSRRTDIWGAIDILAMHPVKGYKAIQIGTQEGRRVRRRKVERLPWPYLEPFVTIDYWETRAEWEGRRARHYFRVHRYDPHAKEIIEKDKSRWNPRARALYLWKVLPDLIEVPREMV